MPTSAQGAVSASARLSVDGSEGDREPARDNVTPFNVDYHRRASARSECLNSDTCPVNRNQVAFDDAVRLPGAVANVDALAVEPLVIFVISQWTLSTRRRDFEVIRAFDVIGVVDQWARDAAHALAIFDGDGLYAIDRDAERPSRVA